MDLRNVELNNENTRTVKYTLHTEHDNTEKVAVRN